MPTDKQIQASRANGAKSKGPVTPQGKRNSSRNATRHGLLAQTVVLQAESAERFHELHASLIEEFQPSTAAQNLLVETMAVARWRLWRVWGIQSSALDREIALQDPSLGPPSVRAISAFRPSSDGNAHPAELLLRYEIAFDRQFTRALHRLLALQSQPEPRKLARSGLAYHPDSPGGRTWSDQNPQPAPVPPSPAAAPAQPPENSLAKRTREPVEALASTRDSARSIRYGTAAVKARGTRDLAMDQACGRRGPGSRFRLHAAYGMSPIPPILRVSRWNES